MMLLFYGKIIMVKDLDYLEIWKLQKDLLQEKKSLSKIQRKKS